MSDTAPQTVAVTMYMLEIVAVAVTCARPDESVGLITLRNVSPAGLLENVTVWRRTKFRFRTPSWGSFFKFVGSLLFSSNLPSNKQ